MGFFFSIRTQHGGRNPLYKSILLFWIVLEDGLHVCIQMALAAFTTSRTGPSHVCMHGNENSLSLVTSCTAPFSLSFTSLLLLHVTISSS